MIIQQLHSHQGSVGFICGKFISLPRNEMFSKNSVQKGEKIINLTTACCLGPVMVQDPVYIQQAAGSIKLTHGSGLESSYCV